MLIEEKSAKGNCNSSSSFKKKHYYVTGSGYYDFAKQVLTLNTVETKRTVRAAKCKTTIPNSRRSIFHS